MVKAHNPISWENTPSINTPINEANLNKMDYTIGILDDRIIAQDTSKLDKSTANTMVQDVTFDEATGIFTVIKLNGSTFKIDTKLEKITVNFRFDKDTQKLVIILDDGTEQAIDLSALITQYEFKESDTIILTVDTDGKVYGTIKKGSITEDMLQPNYLADIKVETAKSQQSMENAKISEINAKESEEKAKQYAEDANMYEAMTARTVSGENPSVTDSTKAPFIYMKNEGYTEQKSYSGKNLLKNTATSQTANGVTFTVNDDKSITVSGTSTSEIYKHIGDIENKTDEILRYIIKGCPSGGSDSKYFIQVNTIGGASRDYGDGRSFEIGAGESFAVYLYVASGVTINSTFYPMISADGGTYEPYCGGTPSPNPDYPQRIASNGDKGYFDGELVQGYYNQSSTVTSNPNMVACKNFISCNENDVIKVIYEETIQRTNGSVFMVTFFDKNKGFLSSVASGYPISAKEFECIAPSNAKYFLFDIRKDAAFSVEDAKHISVTINGMYALRVKSVGKNLIKTSETISTTASNSYIAITLGEYNLKANTTYFFSCSSNVGTNYKLWFRNSDASVIKTVVKGNSFTLTENVLSEVSYIQLVIEGLASGTTYNGYVYAQVELGDTATPYEPYQESTALIPISSPLYDGDYFEVYSDGSGKIVMENVSYISDGSESGWFLSGTVICLPSLWGELNSAIGYADRLMHTSGYATGINLFDTQYKQIRVYANGRTLAEFKEELSENPIHFVIKLAEPTTEPLTPEQVQAFKQLQTFDEVTHINADGTITVRYYCNTDSGDTVGMLHEMVEEVADKLPKGIEKIDSCFVGQGVTENSKEINFGVGKYKYLILAIESQSSIVGTTVIASTFSISTSYAINCESGSHSARYSTTGGIQSLSMSSTQAGMATGAVLYGVLN